MFCVWNEEDGGLGNQDEVRKTEKAVEGLENLKQSHAWMNKFAYQCLLLLLVNWKREVHFYLIFSTQTANSTSQSFGKHFYIMSDHTPEEVMANILLRLRVKDIFICRSVSKQWLSIIDDPHFISRHLQHSISTNSNAALFLRDRNFPILYWKRRYDSDVNFFSTPNDHKPTRVMLMGSCHGLVCFTLFDHQRDFVVLNPSTGEWHTVSCPMVEIRLRERLEAFGFGYDESSGDYKVVRIIQTMDYSYSCSYHAEIIGVRSFDFFRTIPLPIAGFGHLNFKFIGVFVGGSIHWCTLLFTRTLTCAFEHVIHAIDLVSNTYHQLQFPDYNFAGNGFFTLNVGTVGTCLSLCGVNMDGRKIGIWVMEEYGNPESWNRLYYIEYQGCYPYAVTTVGSNGDQILLMLNWCELSWYDPSKHEDGTILTHDACWGCGPYEALYCLESLVKIFPNAGADVKRHAYEKQLKRLADQEIPKSCHPDFLDMYNLNALKYEDSSEPYVSDEELYVDSEFSDSEF